MNKYKFNDIASFVYGKMPSKEKIVEDGFPIYSGYRFSGFYSEYQYDCEKLILICRGVGGTGKVKIAPKKSFITNLSIIINENSLLVDYKYLYYYLGSFDLKSLLDTGSCQSQITINELGNFNVSVPKLSTQQKIASVLSSLDDKIELNNKINAELEAMAKTLYDYWFVQFEFPNEKEEPYKSSGGKMVYNDVLKREIPEGWEVKKLDNCIHKIIDYRGRTPKKMDSEWSENSNDIIAISAKHIKQGKLVNLEVANRVDEALYSKWMKEELAEGDILMTSEAPCGEFFYLIGETKYCLSQRVFAMRSDPHVINHSCLYFELSFGNGYSQIMGKVSGSTVFGIRQDELRTVNILIPLFNLQNKFSEKILPIYERIRNNQKQNQELTQLRDWLLPMLMNGQVKVEDVEEQVFDMVAEPSATYEKVANTCKIETKEDRFELWLSNQKLAARGDIDEVVLREIFDAMDDEDQ
ncbi:restriction endonuclease subunit S [Empedobacter falsenii]|uniref:restriction endonuclease subunit S n=1 Tax=Empedobacter falsenii TaxID=343874 RepID=UPI00257821E3|nr:restriction endonuclease subunit S [Empedobacter falsenii]MDM1299853.1 restriction endonuclease subunit S [Empedobacter falsenii]MDM1319645.1 restriction endonuclease subunit S [Empedobacter falsenii]